MATQTPYPQPTPSDILPAPTDQTPVSDTTGSTSPASSAPAGTGEPAAPDFSGGGGSGGSADTQLERANMITAATQVYESLWGQFPPPGYIEKLIDSGFNLTEIELYERQKPAFAQSKTYRDQQASFAAQLAQLFGMGR